MLYFFGGTFYLKFHALLFHSRAFQFLTRLKRNNKRDWFQAHQEEWENDVRQPVLRFITDFAAPLYEVAPIWLPIRGPHEDLCSASIATRDSPHDKRPYKTNVAMRFSHRGKDVHSPGFYLHLEPGGCFAASGLWHPEPANTAEGPQCYGFAPQGMAGSAQAS